MGSVQREEVKAYVFQDSIGPGHLADLIEDLRDLLHRVPDEYRDKIEYEVSIHEDREEPFHILRVWYMRPETDMELKSRIAREMNRYEAEARRFGSQAHLAEGLYEFYKAERERLEKELPRGKHEVEQARLERMK